MKKISFLVLRLAAVASAAFYHAVTLADAPASPINSAQDIINFFGTTRDWVASAFWIAAVISGFYAGFLYLTAGGESEKVSKAHKQLLYTVIAIIAGLMAYGLPALVQSILIGK